MKKFIALLLTTVMMFGILEFAFTNKVNADGWTKDPIPVDKIEGYENVRKEYTHEREDGGMTYIIRTHDAYYIEEFPGKNSGYRTKKIPNELPIGGGFYNDGTYNYLVFAKNHREAEWTKDLEEMRIVKYDRDWNRISSCSVSGICMTSFFYFGGCEITGNNNGQLIVDFCGNAPYHQINLIAIVDTNNMTYKLWGTGVSHSIQQDACCDGDEFYAVDLMYPDVAELQLIYYMPYNMNSNLSWSCKSVDVSRELVKYFGIKDDRTSTGSYVYGGYDTPSMLCAGVTLSDTANKVLVAGVAPDYDEPNKTVYDYNVFVYSCDMKTLDNGKIDIITDYSYDSNRRAGDTRLFKVNDDKFILAWQEYKMRTTSYNEDYFVGEKCVALDGNGKVISEIHNLGDIRMVTVPYRSKPIVTSDGMLKWIYTEGNVRMIEILNPNTFEVTHSPLPTVGYEATYDYDAALNNNTEPGVGGFIERLYSVALGRASDPAGKADWIDKVTTQGYTGTKLAEGFLYSPEFLGKNMSDSEFVSCLYATFFNRRHDEAGMNVWLNALAHGTSRKEVIRGFIDSTEFANLCLSYGIVSGCKATPNITIEPTQDIYDFVTRLYSKCLGRNPDENGLHDWAYSLSNMKVSGSKAAHGFFFSNEFVSKNVSDEEYVTLLYRVFMNREPDSAGYNDWVSRLKSGTSREDVFNGFAGSQEWSGICAGYGIIK